jgi:hypothetical protein
MKFYSTVNNGKWTKHRLSHEEIDGLKVVTIQEAVKIFKTIHKVAAALEAKLTSEEVKAIFDKIAPTFNDVAQDYTEDLAQKSKEIPPVA